MPADLYNVLGIPNDASAEEIKRAYRERVREYHPDVNDHPEGDAQFKLIRKANDVLTDSAERTTYDRLGHREYVDKHLEDLPPVSVFPDEDLPDRTSTRDDATATDTSTATGRTTTGSSARSDATTASSSSTANNSQSTSAASNNPSASQTGDGSAGSTSDRSTTGSETDPNSTDEQSTTAGADRSSWDAATSSTQSTASESTVPAGVRRRRGLKRWYGVVALSLLLYLGGLGLYALPRQTALLAFANDVAATPVTLLGAFPLSSPTEYLLGAARAGMAGAPELGLVLLAGTALLPLVVLTTVGRFGRGLAWMYALPSIAPAVCFAAWPFVAVPTWLALLGLIVLPILSGGGFLVDVGRYLRATR